VLAAVTAITGAALAIYADSFSVPFVFDDHVRIVGNRSIYRIWPPWTLFSENLRPVAYITFALNYSVHGIHVWGYHAVNLAIHTAAALALFGLVRRTFSRGRLAARYGRHSCGLGLTVALLWMAHPLQTESVTYVVQRIESLMGLFYLLTLYCFLRAQESGRLECRVGTEDAAGRLKVRLPRSKSGGFCSPAETAGRLNVRIVWWYVGSVVCCALGMTTKEVMVTAPVMVLWYDRVFVAASWREILRRRGAFYAPLACTWGLLAFLMLSKSSAYVSAGALVVQGVSPLQYALTQPGVILHYLRLSFWPWGQCIDYGWPIARTAGQIVPPLVAVIGLLGATVWCMFRRAQWGFVGGWFFMILAPTSSIAPIKDLAFEHRMYLSLAAVVVTVVMVGYGLAERIAASRAFGPGWRRAVQVAPVVAAVLVLGWLTHLRNQAYETEVSLWRDVIRKAPHHARGHVNLGTALLREGSRFHEAESCFRRALQIQPNNASAQRNLGIALAERGSLEEAVRQYEKALQIRPNYAPTYNNLGRVVEKQGKPDLALKYYQHALKLDPGNPITLLFLGILRENQGRLKEAAQHYHHAVTARPHHDVAYTRLAMLAAKQGKLDEMTDHLRKALWYSPHRATVHCDLAESLGETQPELAIEHYRTALRLEPGYVNAHNKLGRLLADRGDFRGAIHHFEEALKFKPNHADVHLNLAIALARQSRLKEAARHLREAIRIKPECAATIQQEPDLKAVPIPQSSDRASEASGQENTGG